MKQGKKDEGFIFLALYCTKSGLLRYGVILPPTRANAYLFILSTICSTSLADNNMTHRIQPTIKIRLLVLPKWYLFEVK